MPISSINKVVIASIWPGTGSRKASGKPPPRLCLGLVQAPQAVFLFKPHGFDFVQHTFEVDRRLVGRT